MTTGEGLELKKGEGVLRVSLVTDLAAFVGVVPTAGKCTGAE